MSNATPPDKARQLRLRHKRERQTVVFGVLVAAMAVAALLAVAIYNGTISGPFAVPFASASVSADTVSTPPCLVNESAKPVAYKKIKLNVYNASDHKGLAATAASALEQRGFQVLSTGNSTAAVSGVRISFGEKGISRAYTLKAHFADAVLYYDARTTATLDVTLGQNYDGLVDEDTVALDPSTPLENLPGCVPADQLTPAAAPVKPSSSPSTSG